MNPYRAAPGSDPPVLAGRDAELAAGARAISLTKEGGAARAIIFTGLRGMGKTALLRRMERLAAAEGAIVISAEATPQGLLGPTLRDGLEDARKALTPISSRLKDAVDVVLSAIPQASFELPDNLGSFTVKTKVRKEQDRLVGALGELNLEVRKHKKWLAISLDEIQHADPLTLDALITVVHKTAGTDEPVLFLGAGLRNAQAHLKSVRTYTERWNYLELDLLSVNETMQAIQEPARENGIAFTPDALQEIAAASKGYPFFIQEYASTAWSQHDFSHKKITLTDVRGTIPMVQKSLDREFYGLPFSRLTARELAYVLAMATLGEGEHLSSEVAAGISLTSRDASSTRSQLVKKDIIFSPDAGVVEFRVPLMATYVTEHLLELQQMTDRRFAIKAKSVTPGQAGLSL